MPYSDWLLYTFMKEPHQMCLCLRMHQQHVFLTWFFIFIFQKTKEFRSLIGRPRTINIHENEEKFIELAQSQ